MKNEIEIRLLNVDVDLFIKNITKLGAKKVGSFFQRRYVYDFNPVNKNKWIRLRTNGEKTTLTIKEIVDRDAIDGTRELEMEVSDFETTGSILNELGYFHRNYQENYREIYTLNDVEISIDSWPLIPTYVELEAQSEDNINSLLRVIEYDKNDATTLDVVSIYQKIYGIDILSIKELKFSDEKSVLEHNKQMQ